MRDYPHGLDEEILPDDLEIEQETINELKDDLETAKEENNALYFQALGEAYYSVACYGYALGETPTKTRELLVKALEYHFTSFKMGIVLDAYEFITLISLAIVLGEKETSDALAKTERLRYTDDDVETEEIVFVTAELLSAFVLKDGNRISRILSTNNPDSIDSKKIYRYDRLIFFPLLQLLHAIHQKDANKFVSALQTRENEFVRFFSRTDELNDPEALIDISGLAVTKIAAERGVTFIDASVYRPAGL